jgi:uncharacterized protein
LVKLVSGLMLALAISALGAPSALGAGAAARGTITVTGTGIVTSVPDQADFTFGVSTTAATATAALAADSSQMRRLIDALKKQGIAARDIQTAEVSLSPNTNANGNRVIGYTASNSVTARIRKLANAGPVVDAAVRAGANEVGGPSLTSADANALYRRALKAAIANARGKAATIAGAARLKLGAIRSVDESSSSVTPFAKTLPSAAASSSTPVQPGTIQTEADVTVVFNTG